MKSKSPSKTEATITTQAMEMIVSGFLMLIAAVVMWDNWKTGAKWGAFGPEAGYFPFRVALILFTASGFNFLLNLLGDRIGRPPKRDNFVDRSQLKLVLQVLIPSAVFVASIGFLGVYLAGGLFVAFFMWWLGNYPIHKIAPVAILMPIAMFLMFERWFLVPMPKGPLEAALGF